jgi:hypothetical protein
MALLETTKLAGYFSRRARSLPLLTENPEPEPKLLHRPVIIGGRNSGRTIWKTLSQTGALFFSVKRLSRRRT